MNIILKRLKSYNGGIRRTLLGTFIMNLICTSILLMFAFGLKDITNETLSENDLVQLMGIISSIIAIAILCIIFLQWIIGIEINTLFNSRRQFNINMRLMGLSGKELRGIYYKELLQMQYVAVPVGVLLTELVYYFVSKRMEIPWIGIDKLIVTVLIHLACIFICMHIALRKLTNVEVTSFMRGGVKRTKEKDNKFSNIFAVLGVIVLIVTVFLNWILKVKELELFYVVGILLISSRGIYLFNKGVIKLGDSKGFPQPAFAARIENGNYKKAKNTILMLSIGIMFFMGLQILYSSARAMTRQTGENAIHYTSYISYREPINTDNYDLDNVYFGLNYTFYIEESSYPKYLYGIDQNYMNYEDIKINQSLGSTELLSYINEPDWNGIIVPSSMISKENIGEERIININGIDIPFKIVGGYYQNLAHKNIWFANKAYIQKQLNLNGYSNCAYLKNNDTAVMQALEKLSKSEVECKAEIIQKSVDKVVQSTETVEITSFIVILCAIVSLISHLVLGAKENIYNIAKFRSAGMSSRQVKIIYLSQLWGMILKGFIIGIILAVLFAKMSLMAMFNGMNAEILISYPFKITICLFIVINVVITAIFLFSTSDGFKNNFTIILRKSEG
ncbi:FtsX-like permease family protein [Cellulosilyticum ruminicola]|uniref:FtsX-like permease family protein n=1 Tax=Cellulosilyticum ruminicola TaxID=425254 RepID=UPI0006D038C0|nr:FtsX-like permease family protein [Cellulosilyticum ruminicola]